MTPEQFCYWLQGRAELQPDKVPTAAEWKMIREHLAGTFIKVTPQLQIDTTPRSPTVQPSRVWTECTSGGAAPAFPAIATC